MYKPKRIRILLPLALAGALSACGGGGGGGSTPDSNPPTPPVANQPPVVTAAPLAGETMELLPVSLSVETSDPDGDKLTFEWKQTAGTPVEFDGGDTAKISFTAPKVFESETLSFTVTVNDGNDHEVKESTGILVNEGETVVMLASLAQSNAIEAFRRHATDSQPVHLDTPVPMLTEDEFVEALSIKISPDRKHVAWLACPIDDDNNCELKVAPVSGAGVRSLTPDVDPAIDEGIWKFEWSPDGSSIAFARGGDAGVGLYVASVANIESEGARNVTGPVTESLDIDNFYWSPNGSRLAVIGRMKSSLINRLFFANPNSVDGSDLRMVSEEIGSPGARVGAWSPDSSSFIFAADFDGNGILELFKVNADSVDGSDKQQLTDEGSDEVNVIADGIKFSPDGTHVAIIAGGLSGSKTELFTLEFKEGEHPDRVSGSSMSSSNITAFEWSPDSQFLAFTGNIENANNTELFVVDRDVDGSNERRKVSGPLTDLGTPPDDVLDGDVEAFAWSPDGKQIAFVGEGVVREGLTDVFIVDADGNGDDRRTVSGATTGFTNGASEFNKIRWSSDGENLYFIGDILVHDEYELLKVASDSTDGGDRVSVSGPPATGGGHVSEYDVGGPSD